MCSSRRPSCERPRCAGDHSGVGDWCVSLHLPDWPGRFPRAAASKSRVSILGAPRFSERGWAGAPRPPLRAVATKHPPPARGFREKGSLLSGRAWRARPQSPGRKAVCEASNRAPNDTPDWFRPRRHRGGGACEGREKLNAMADQIEWETSRRGDNDESGRIPAIFLTFTAAIYK